jgi:hypothetical protein
MAFRIPGGYIAKGQTVSWSIAWDDLIDRGAVLVLARPAVHDCALVTFDHSHWFEQVGSGVRQHYGFKIRNDGWTETYCEIDGGGLT